MPPSIITPVATSAMLAGSGATDWPTRAARAIGPARAAVLDGAAERYARLGAGRAFGWEGALGWITAPYWLGRLEEERSRLDAARRAYAAFLARQPGPQADERPESRIVVDARRRLVTRRAGDQRVPM